MSMEPDDFDVPDEFDDETEKLILSFNRREKGEKRMKFMTITYRCGETVPLEGHGGPAFKFANVQPSVEVTVELDQSDNPAQVRQELQQRTLMALNELKALQIKQALSHGEPPKATTQGGTWQAVNAGPQPQQSAPPVPGGYVGTQPQQQPQQQNGPQGGIPRVDSQTF